MKDVVGPKRVYDVVGVAQHTSVVTDDAERQILDATHDGCLNQRYGLRLFLQRFGRFPAGNI